MTTAADNALANATEAMLRIQRQSLTWRVKSTLWHYVYRPRLAVLRAVAKRCDRLSERLRQGAVFETWIDLKAERRAKRESLDPGFLTRLSPGSDLRGGARLRQLAAQVVVSISGAARRSTCGREGCTCLRCAPPREVQR